MRRTTRIAIEGFLSSNPVRIGNTVATRQGVWLHDNMIIRRGKTYVEINNRGYTTRTTQRRLNGLLELMEYPLSIVIRQLKWFWSNGETFPSNEWIEIRPEKS